MTASLARSTAIAAASARDVLRRPGGLIALALGIVVLAFTPSVSARALDDAGLLAPRLAVSSIHLYAVLFAVWFGPSLTTPSSSLGYSAEYEATALRPLEYVAGRMLGLTGVATLHLAVLALVGTVACAAAGMEPGVELLLAPLTGAIQALVLLGLGALLGAAAGATLGTLLVALVVIAGRLAPPGLTESAPYALLLPDLLRLDSGAAAAPEFRSMILAAAGALATSMGYAACGAAVLSARGARSSGSGT